MQLTSAAGALGSATLLLVTLVGLAVGFAVQMAPEGSLLAVWGLAFVLSYWRTRKSSETSWRAVLPSTAITASVWMICIIGSSLMYARIQPLVPLFLHTILVSLAGAAVALLAAGLLHAIELAGRRWLAAGTGKRILLVAASLALLAFTYGAWTLWDAQYWHPAVLPEDSVDRRTENAITSGEIGLRGDRNRAVC